MIRSMTGFGHATAECNGITVSAEISSLNHRYLDIGIKMPAALGPLENDARKLLQAHFERGRVNVMLAVRGELPEASQVELDQALARQYVDRTRAFARELGLRDEIAASSILRLGTLWTLRSPRPEAMSEVWEPVKKALTGAIEKLVAMRESEGANIWSDISERLGQVEAVAKDIEAGAQGVIDHYRERLKDRIDSILPAGAEMDEQRLLAEVAVFADRADISEELARMESHIQQFGALAGQGANVGRRLDFLLQEMFRETTTIGSKARDARISHKIVEIKGHLEKMREQVQNVERNGPPRPPGERSDLANIISIGFGAVIMRDKIVAVVLPDSKPSIRLRDAAKDENRLIDATQGHKTRAIIVTTSNHIILCGVNPETLAQRIKDTET